MAPSNTRVLRPLGCATASSLLRSSRQPIIFTRLTVFRAKLFAQLPVLVPQHVGGRSVQRLLLQASTQCNGCKLPAGTPKASHPAAPGPPVAAAAGCGSTNPAASRAGSAVRASVGDRVLEP
jgi:hypothetical protein